MRNIIKNLKYIFLQYLSILINNKYHTNKGHTRDAGPRFAYSCRKHFLLTNNEIRVSGFFWMGTLFIYLFIFFLSKINGIIQCNVKNP